METIVVPVDAETKRRLEQLACAQGLSLDAWAAEVLRRAALAEWPEVVRQLAGAWGEDFPEPAELRRSLERESLRESP